jgi:hypothetical protein
MNLDVVLGRLRKLGYRVKINHFRQVFSDDGYDCLQLHEINSTHHVFNNGGFTTVEVIRPDGVSLHGKHNFSARKAFVRRIGVVSALGRAFECQANLVSVLQG